MFDNRVDFVPTFVLPVLSQDGVHWKDNRVSFVYFSDLERDAFVNIHHVDMPNATTRPTINDLNLSDTFYAVPMNIDPDGSHAVMCQMSYWLNTGKRYEFPDRPVRRLASNDHVPIMRWLGWCRQVRDELIGLPTNAEYDRFAWNLRRLERSITKNIHYNPYTITGRPTHDEVKNIESVNGILIEVDFRAFHMFLIHLVCGLEFDPDIYNSLSKYYPSGVDPKAFTFKQIYGGIDPELRQITPFKEIGSLADELFGHYKQGDLVTALHKVRVNYPQNLPRVKVFNYWMQNFETEFNMGLMDELLNISGFKSKPVLYTYDSFVFDVCPDEYTAYVDRLEQIFSPIPFKVNKQKQ